MTPREKAKELFNIFEYKVMGDQNGSAHKGKQKDCVDIVCDEIIKSHELFGTEQLEYVEYYNNVKREVSLL